MRRRRRIFYLLMQWLRAACDAARRFLIKAFFDYGFTNKAKMNIVNKEDFLRSEAEKI